MKILIPFKVVPDLEMLAEDDWTADGSQVDTSFARKVLNCFDESAIEILLKLSDLSEGFNVFYQLYAMTIGPDYCDPFLKTLYALGFQKTVRIKRDGNNLVAAEKNARIIADYVKQREKIDVIVMGRQSADGDYGKTHFIVAELLGIPCISQVVQIEPVDEQHLKVHRLTEQGRWIQVVKTPCVMIVGDAPGTYLRVPTLRDRMRLGNQPIEILAEPLAEEDDFLELQQLVPVETKRNGTMIQGKSAVEMAGELYHSYLKGRLKS